MALARFAPGQAAWVALVALIGACGGGCKKTMTAPAIQGLRPADDARGGLLATVTIAPLDRTAAKIDDLARKLQLPFSGKDMVTSLAVQQELSPEAAALLDGRRPIGMAFVAAAKDAPPAQAIAVAARSPADAEKVVAALGTSDERKGPARRVRRPSGQTLWVVVHQATLIGAATFEALEAAGTLAVEAQRDTSEEVVARLHPDALARWRGTDVRTALRTFREEMVAQQLREAQARGGAVPGRAERLMLEAMLDAVMAPLAETAVGAVSLAVDTERGIRLGLRLEPRRGSALEKRTKVSAPYSVDPAVLAAGSGALAGLWATGPSPFWLDVHDHVLAAQAAAGVRGAADVVAHWRRLRPQLTGAMIAGMRAGREGLSYDLVLPLSGNGAGVVDNLGALLAAPGFADFLREVYGRVAPEVKSRREGGALRAELAFPVRDRPGDVGTVLKALSGSPTVTTLLTVSRGRLVASTEPGARGRLDVLAAGRPSQPPPELASWLAETRGHDGFGYFDLWATLRPLVGAMGGLGSGEQQMLKMVSVALGDPKLPLLMNYRGGDAITAELRVPMSTLSNAAGVLRPFLGLGAAPRP